MDRISLCRHGWLLTHWLMLPHLVWERKKLWKYLRQPRKSFILAHASEGASMASELSAFSFCHSSIYPGRCAWQSKGTHLASQKTVNQTPWSSSRVYLVTFHPLNQSLTPFRSLEHWNCRILPVLAPGCHNRQIDTKHKSLWVTLLEHSLKT